MKKLLVFISLLLLFACEEEPTADFSYSGSTEVGEMIRFENLSTNSTDFEWDFGDGSTSSSESPSHRYLKPGYYRVSLTAKGDGGSASASKTLDIDGTTYSIKNATSYTLYNFCSYHWNGSDIEDFVEHGTISSGQVTGIVITAHTAIDFGFTYEGVTYISVNSFNLTRGRHNDLVITNETQIYGENKKSMGAVAAKNCLRKKAAYESRIH